MKRRPVTVAAIGIDHRHIYDQIEGMRAAGATCKGWWTDGQPVTLEGFHKRFPDLPHVRDRSQLLEDPDVELVLIAAVPSDRARFAIEAMRHGKDVMVDKPGCTTFADLDAIRTAVAETGRIWSVNFSERFQVRAVEKAAELVAAGAIGRVVQTVGLGPHRFNRPLRPDWFFQRDKTGGILCDLGSHQIDQFLFFTGSNTAEIVASTVANFAWPDDPGVEDFGEILLRGDRGHGYVRVDWYTPDALPNWGDGRLTILGTEGYIEVRKFVDVAGRPGADHLFLVNGKRCEYVDCSGLALPYFARLAADIRDRTETAMPQSHAFTVTELALLAQSRAVRTGHLVAMRNSPVASNDLSD
jgi:predicted dehydrogenase